MDYTGGHGPIQRASLKQKGLCVQNNSEIIRLTKTNSQYRDYCDTKGGRHCFNLCLNLCYWLQKQQTLAGSEFHRNGSDTNEEK